MLVCFSFWGDSWTVALASGLDDAEKFEPLYEASQVADSVGSSQC